MAKSIILAILLFCVISGRSQTIFSKVLYSKDFITKHPDWKVSGDTIRVDTLIGYKGIRLPIRLSWTVATDTSGCFRIAYFKIESIKNTKIKISNFKSTNIPCGMKWESEDHRRFETLFFYGNYSAYKGIKEYSFSGSLGTVKGNGEYTVTEFK